PTPPTTGTPGASPSEEQYLVDAANAERADHGRAPLATHSTLTSLARTKARDMAVNGYFDHVSPTLGTARDQMLAAGLNPKYWGENIGMGGSGQTIHRAIMEGHGHRANILSAGCTHMAAGWSARAGGFGWPRCSCSPGKRPGACRRQESRAAGGSPDGPAAPVLRRGRALRAHWASVTRVRWPKTDGSCHPFPVRSFQVAM